MSVSARVGILALLILSGCQRSAPWTLATEASAGEAAPSRAPFADDAPCSFDAPTLPTQPSTPIVEAIGKTRTVPSRLGAICTMIQHPVIKIHVAAGDRVKEGQPLIDLDADEPEAEVRSKRATVAELQAGLARLKALPRAEERAEARATLEGAQVTARAAHALLDRIHALHAQDAVSTKQHNEAHTAALKADADVKASQAHLDYLLKLPIEQEIEEQASRLAAAQAELEAFEAELEHYTIHAPIDGVVSWLDVSLGTVSRPGTSTWGEIVDLSEIDVRCELPAEQVDRLDLDQSVEIIQRNAERTRWNGRIVFVGPAADTRTGLVPVVARVADAGGRLRANLEVTARLSLRNENNLPYTAEPMAAK